jgi:hypothetical protein
MYIVACRPATGQRLRDKEKEPLLSNAFADRDVSTEMIDLQQRGAVFPARSMLRLVAAVSQWRLDDWCKMAASLGLRQLKWNISQSVRTFAETLLGSVTRK